MRTLQDEIVDRLTNSFIMDRAVDADALAGVMLRKYPGVERAELSQAIKLVAVGIGVHIKDPLHEHDRSQELSGACV